jgi:hypothetical protein
VLLILFWIVFLKFASDFCSSWQNTALHGAAENGHTPACQLLIDAKADVNATDECAVMFEMCF